MANAMLAWLLLWGASAIAQTADVDDLERALADYRTSYELRLASLEAEVAELRRERGPELAVSETRARGAGPPRLRISGFGHVQYDIGRLSPRTPSSRETTNHFTVGGVVLFLSSQIAEDVRFFAESELDFSSDGEGKLDLERAMVEFDWRSWLRVGAGRGHTALGYWNQRFHHGTWLQTTTERPLIYAFPGDGGLLPIHFAGLEFTGDIETGWGLVSYHANLANGRGDSLGQVQMTHDRDDSKLVSLMATLQPREDFGIGFSVLSDRLPGEPALDPSRAHRIEELIFGLHSYYEVHPYEFVAEVLSIAHDDHSVNQHFNHYGGYLQLGYAMGTLKPYYRYDFLNIESGDPFYTDFATGSPRLRAEDTTQHTLGVRWDLRSYLALKAEYRRLRSARERENAATLQASFAF